MRLIGALLILILVDVCQAQQDPFATSSWEGPTYQGRTLGDWTAVAESKSRALRLKAVAALEYMGPPAIPALTRLLRDEDSAVCRAAASSLGKIGPAAKAAVPALTRLLRDKDKDIRIAAIQALREMGPEARMAVPVLIELLDDKDAGYEAVWTLEAIGPEAKAAVPALNRLLKDEDLRHTAASALGEIGPEARTAVPALIELLKEEEGRQFVALALGRIGPDAKGAAVALTKVLGDKDTSVRRTAAWALGKIGPDARTSVPALTELLKDKEARWDAAFALGRIGSASEPAVPALVELLRHEHHILDDVFQALGRIGPAAKGAVPALLHGLQDKKSFDRRMAAWALGKIRPQSKDAISSLAGLLKDKQENREFRQIAASILVKIEPTSIPTFADLLNNQDEQTRLIAIWGLGEIGPDANVAVPALTRVLKERSGLARLAATRALGKIGPSAQAAVPALTEVLKDKDSLLRWAVVRTMGEIGREAGASSPALTALLGDDNREVRDAAAAALGRGRPKTQLPAVESKRIKELIADLANISDEGQLSVDFGAIDFPPMASVEPFRTQRKEMQMPKPNAAFTSLVELGPVAIPLLLESLNDKTPSKLIVDNRSSVYGMWLRHEIPGNGLNSQEVKVLGDAIALHEEDMWYERQLAWYNVTVGDICLAVIGQITNRPYKPLDGAKSTYITSPVEDPKLAEQLRAIWGESGHRQKLLESLLVDLETWSEFQDGAAMRLVYYFPEAADDLIIARLEELEAAAVGAAPYDFSVKIEEMVTQAVAWSNRPRLRAKMLDMCRKTEHGKVLLATLPAVGKEHDELVLRRLLEQLDAVPKNDLQWHWHEVDLLRGLAERFPDRTEDVFRGLLRSEAVSRRLAIIHALRFPRGDLAIRILAPLLEDRRAAYKDDPTVTGPERSTLVCDEAAEAIALHSETLKFDKKGSREYLDRQIDTMRRKIGEMKTSK